MEQIVESILGQVAIGSSSSRAVISSQNTSLQFTLQSHPHTRNQFGYGILERFHKKPPHEISNPILCLFGVSLIDKKDLVRRVLFNKIHKVTSVFKSLESHHCGRSRDHNRTTHIRRGRSPTPGSLQCLRTNQLLILHNQC